MLVKNVYVIYVKWKTQKKEKDLIIAAYRAQLQNKDQEYDVLRQQLQTLQNAYDRLWIDYDHIDGQNITLNSEIEKLRALCERMEKVYGIGNPMAYPSSKRRKIEENTPSSNANTPIKNVPSTQINGNQHAKKIKETILKTLPFYDDETLPLVVKSCQFQGDWKGLELQNVSDSRLIIDDWYLSNQNALKVLLPRNFPPSGILRIGFGEKMSDSDIILNHSTYYELKDSTELWLRDKFNNAVLLTKLPPDMWQSEGSDDETRHIS